MSDKTSVVIVGVERSKFAGDCPGAELDARNMQSILKDYSLNVTLLLNESATKAAVKNALTKALDSDLVIFYYSGHGGSEKFSDTGSEEVDGKDEFLCLHDTFMRDNDLWKIMSGAKGEVFEIFDCCHSQTMFRTPGITFRNSIPLAGSRDGSSSPSLLVWSGCPDNTYSYGSSTGGQMTNTLRKHFSSDLSYAELWDKISSDKILQKYEIVQKTVLGSFPESKKIFS